MKHKFSIDATFIPKQPTGIGNYTLQLIKWLSTHIRQGSDKLYIFGRSDQKNIAELKETEFIDCGYFNTLKRIIWEQTHLPALLKKYEIDLIHSPNYSIPLFAKCKTVCTIHDLTCYLFPKRRKFIHGFYFRKMIKCSVNYADFIIAVSNNTKKDIEKTLKKKVDNIEVIYQGFDPLYSNITDDKKIAQDKDVALSKPYFLFVSTIEPSKNAERLINAFSKFLSDSNSDYMLYLVGKLGWGYQKILTRINDSELKNNIRYLGYKKENELSQLYKNAFAFIYPSLYEGFGIPPLEAMACGTPVLCSNTSSLPEVVGNAALTFNPYSEEEIAHAIKTITEDMNLRQLLIEKGYKRVKMFSWEKSAKEILEIYYKLVNEKND